jgi:hypothetical protein
MHATILDICYRLRENIYLNNKLLVILKLLLTFNLLIILKVIL